MLSETRPTLMLHEASRSADPVSSSMAVKVTLGLILGLMPGVLAAFVVEFLVGARRRSPVIESSYGVCSLNGPSAARPLRW